MVALEDIDSMRETRPGFRWNIIRGYNHSRSLAQTQNKMDSTTEETTSKPKDVTSLHSPKHKKRRIHRGKSVRLLMFPNGKVAKKKPRMKKTKTHKERRESLKKKARAPNTNKGLLCCSDQKS